ncbi:hypothetical protein [Nocardiopsis ganjiahuensis]|nr:hypothetical protein [Nocardiopsis ganjiahuensis]
MPSSTAFGHLFPDRLDEVPRKMGERRDAALRESGDSNGEPGRAA